MLEPRSEPVRPVRLRRSRGAVRPRLVLVDVVAGRGERRARALLPARRLLRRALRRPRSRGRLRRLLPRRRRRAPLSLQLTPRSLV